MKPLICFDIEATGTDPATDRIVSIALMDMYGSTKGDWYVNPGRPIPPEATEIHGITDEVVADLPTFDYHAKAIHALLKDSDLLGFNLTNFDIPILWEEFYRSEIEWDLSETRVLDAGTLFKKREPRTLEAALEFYCGREHNEAHDAMGDVVATCNVWTAQVERYGLSHEDRMKLEEESSYEPRRVDLAGKIVEGPDGRPTYNIGKVKGVAVEDDPGFANWMLQRDFSQNTKNHLMAILYPVESETCQSGEPF